MASHSETGSSDLANTSKAAKRVHPMRQILEAIRNNSKEEIAHVLQLHNCDPKLLSHGLSTAVWRGSVPLTTYLLVDQHAPVEAASLGGILQKPTIELLDVLVSAGWDINQREGNGRLLDAVVYDESLVRFCLEHGAEISDGKENEDAYRYPPLTEYAACDASVSCFKLLRAHGAKLGRRTLHKAVHGAIYSLPENKPDRIAMLEYLINEEGLDVNQLDANESLPDHPGTPIMYAIHDKGGAHVVKWLLDHGANPRIKTPEFGLDALGFAEMLRNKEIQDVLREYLT
ncbi:hypothetical protein G7Y79_00062g093490 [Physcia stellaris]|nr:hypothetical protein G7Y79_00062g093490 [Physcia stellaris]